jgi:hypothetical protein
MIRSVGGNRGGWTTFSGVKPAGGVDTPPAAEQTAAIAERLAKFEAAGNR